MPDVGAHDHDAHDHVMAVFSERLSAEQAVTDLRARGLGSEHLGVAVHGPDSVVFEHDDQVDIVHGLEAGALAGAPVGFVAGLALFSLLIPGLAVGGLLALSTVAAGWGAFLGGYVGIGSGDRAGQSHSLIEQTALAPGEVLVVACRQHDDLTIETIFERHGGRLLTLP